MYNVLICDDEEDIVSAVNIYLGNEKYNLFNAYSGIEAVKIVENNEIHLVLMDIMMPKMDGMEALKRIRESSNVPVIFLTAKGEDIDKILGLNSGADDYITKPFNPIELQARVNSQLRRYMSLGSGQLNDSDILVIGGIELDDRAKRVLLDGVEIKLTKTEYEILKLLMKHKGEVYSPHQIYTKVWKEAAYGTENIVAVHIRHLREKIEYNPAEPRYLKVIWGRGYKIED